MLNPEKAVEKIKEKLEQKGRLEEVRQYVEALSRTPRYKLNEPLTIDIIDSEKVRVPFYSLLEQEGITYDNEGFLRLNGERVAYVNEDIIPLKGKKKELKEALEKIVEIRRELSYPEEVYRLPSHADKENGWFNFEAGKWEYPEDFGLFWRNIDKSIKESEDPFVQALLHLNELSEYDPEEERRRFEEEKELFILSDMDKILEERQRAYFKRYKTLGIPRKKLVTNPEEFYDELGSYALEAFKRIRKIRPKDEIIKSLEKGYKSHTGISKKRKYALLTLGILGSAAIVGAYLNSVYIPQQKEAQRISQLKGVGLTDEQALSFDSIFSKYADSTYFTSIYNQTILNLAKFYGKDPILTQESFKLLNNFKHANDFLSVAIDKTSSLDFVKKYPDLIKSFNYQYPLELYSKNSTIFEELYRNISHDPRVKMNINELTSLASQLFLDLGYTGKVKVLIPRTENYKEEFLKIPTIQAFGNYSFALYQGLPKHGRNTLFLLGNATQINPEIVDFEPILIKDYNGTTFVIQSMNIARDYWLITENLRRDSRLVEHPKWYLALSIMSQQNGWDFFDNPKMKKYKLSPTNSTVWEIVDQLRNWLFNEDRMGFPLDLPWISDSNDKKICYAVLFELPTKVADLDAYLNYTRMSEKYKNGEITREQFLEYIKEHPPIVHHTDLDAMRYTVEKMPRLYEEVMSIYPNGTVGRWNEDPRGFYYSWLGDRGAHGFYYAISQFLGVDVDILKGKIPITWPEWQRLCREGNGIDKHLSNNFSYWDLIKFIHGYGINYGGGDSQMDLLYYPIVFKAFGIPYQLVHYLEHHISAPGRYASGYDGGIFGVPDNIIKSLKEGSYGEVLILPGNGIDFLGIGLEGVKKDLEYGKQNSVEPNAKYMESFLSTRGKKLSL